MQVHCLPTEGHSFVHEVSGRWLECCTSAQKLKCRELHDEPLAKCTDQEIPRGPPKPCTRPKRCLGPGFPASREGAKEQPRCIDVGPPGKLETADGQIFLSAAHGPFP